MVPIHEMTDVLRVVKDAASSSLRRGSWVRIKRGMYKDDIASVSYSIDNTPCTGLVTGEYLHFSAGTLCSG